MREIDVVRRNPAGAVCDELDLYLIICVRPIGMMVHGFGGQGNARHECERLRKILELEFAAEFAVYNLPTGQPLERRGQPLFAEFLRFHSGFPLRADFSRKKHYSISRVPRATERWECAAIESRCDPL